MSKTIYNPHSHFFVDHTNLSTPMVSDAYGPVDGNETTQYRVTSFIRTSTSSKVFAICNGHILIQPQQGVNSKVNLIIKPSASYAPIKIKYFIYRGVDKNDLIDGLNLVPINSSSPDFLQRIWADYISSSTADGSEAPTTFPASEIGYDPTNQSDDLLLDSLFFKSDENSNFQLPKCNKGEYLANFNDKIGLDIVLDYGDYDLDYQEQLFKLNLGYSRKTEHVFDTSTITGAAKQKRYREYILQFLDAAAFWGSHIECGELSLYNISSPTKDATEIFNLVIDKYYTKHNLYLHLIAERGRSYNFYGDYPTGKVTMDLFGSTPSQVDYTTNGWPILIKEFTQSGNVSSLQFSFEYDLDSNIFPPDLNFFLVALFPMWDKENFLDVNQLIRLVTDSSGNPIDLIYTGQCNEIEILFNNILSQSQNKSICCFYICNIKGKQSLPLENYYEDLWFFNNKLVIEIPNNAFQWSAVDKAQLANLHDLVKFRNVKLQQKMYEDLGKDQNGNTKNRKLYIALVEDTHSSEQKSKLNGGNFNTSGAQTNVKNDNYASSIYNIKNCEVYRGKIQDSNNLIYTLSLVNSKDFELKQKYFQLGITEEEYNKLLYNESVVPTTPPTIPHLPSDVDNIFFYLQEDNSISSDKGYRKFELGLKFENGSGNIETKFPSSNRKVEVYTIDGFYFFSKEFSDFQEFYTEFSENELHFRPETNWLGEYGFDWIKIGDSGLSGDTITPENRKYLENIGHYYLNSSSNIKEQGDEANNFRKEKIEFHSINKNYYTYPRQKGSESLYTVPWITIYPSKDRLGNTTLFPKNNFDGSPKCLTDVTLNLILDISSPSSIAQLKLKYETKHFEINSVISSATTPLPDVLDSSGITYSYLQINENSGAYPNSLEIKVKCLDELPHQKKIQVIAIENGKEILSGELLVFPNTKRARNEVEILLVNCETDLVTPGSSVFGIENVPPYTIRDKILSEINRSLNQSLIDIKSFSTTNLDLTRNVRPLFYQKYNTIPNVIYLNPHVEHSFLMSLLNPNLVRNRIVIFCINEFCGDPVPNTSDFEILHGNAPINEAQVILYKSGLYQSQLSIDDPNTSSHECLHSLGLYHSFSNHGLFTFHKYLTDNIMDYNSGNPFGSYRTTTNKFQWEVVRKNNIISIEQ